MSAELGPTPSNPDEHSMASKAKSAAETKAADLASDSIRIADREDAPLLIKIDDLSGEATHELLRFHLKGMHEISPPESVFALDLSGLQQPSVTVWTAWDGGEIAGIGALKELPESVGEIKSMRTHQNHLRKGVAAMLLDHIIVEAKKRRLNRLSLETGSGPAFDPALQLYHRRGFKNGPPFANYRQSTFNQFLHLWLKDEGS